MNARLTTAVRAAFVAMLVVQGAPLLAQSPSGDQKFAGPNRFKVLSDFNNEAVLDRETGLVWEKTPETALGGWAFIDDECFSRLPAGVRGGDRRPSRKS